ncbi:helix-turn-helix transcriptional regulator [Sedimentitalea todarodis]|uniref:helix-turn-helix transcriptional regulator n=1 Tax=Sedimentitalea todarodis TaxID=1631240 RepID=UPI00374481C1
MKYLTCLDVMSRYRISRSTTHRWIENPDVGFPAPIKIGHRILWREADLAAFDAKFARGQVT